MKRIYLLYLCFLFDFIGRTLYALTSHHFGEDKAGDFYFFGRSIGYLCLFIFADRAVKHLRKMDASESEALFFCGTLIIYDVWKDITHTNAAFDLSGYILLAVLSIRVINRQYRRRRARKCA